jgi:phosphate transport system protein
MERIGDLASHVAERAIEIASWPESDTLTEVVMLANGAVEQVARAMTALATRDGIAARRVIQDDQDLDRLHKDILRRMIALGKDQPDQLDRTFAWSSISRNLERIADHACNIAEMVVFYAEGQVLRHGADGLD